LDDAPLVRRELTSHDAEKLWHGAAACRGGRREERREGRKHGRREGVRAKEREEERRRIETKTMGKESRLYEITVDGFLWNISALHTRGNTAPLW